MTDSQLSRRRVLQLSGVTATVAVAGCLGGNGDTGGVYDSYVSAVDGEVTAIYMDVATLSELDDEDPDGGDGFEDEPLIDVPTAGLFSLFFIAGFSLENAGLGGLLDDDANEMYDTEVDEVLLTGETIVITGSIETDEITERIEQEANVEHEQTDEISGFTVYEADDDEDEDGFGMAVESTVAVGDDELILSEQRDDVERVIETIDGDRTAAVDEYDDFEWLRSVIEESNIALAGYVEEGTMEEEDDEFEDEEMLPGDEVIDQAVGFAAGLGITEDEVTADAGLVFAEVDDELEGKIEGEFSTDRTEVDFDFDDDRVTISATFDQDEIDG